MRVRDAIWWAVNGTNFLDWIAYSLIGILGVLLGVQAVLGVLSFFKWLFGG